MANLKTTTDIKVAVLRKAGELEDGTSAFDTAAVEYLDQIHKGLIAGGNEFDIDIDDPWLWAKAKNDIILTLEPPYDTGTATVTLDSAAGVFSSAPADSQKGRFLKLEARDEYFKILEHTAASANFTIDQPYTEATGTLNFKSIPLDYDLVDDSIVIDATNTSIDFTDDAGSYAVVIPEAAYATPAALATAVATAMNASASDTITVSFDDDTRKFTVASNGATTFTLSFASGANALTSAAEPLGFDDINYVDAFTYTSINPLNAIERLIQPMVVYRTADNAWSSPYNSGDITSIDLNTLVRQYPMVDLRAGVPTRFAEVFRTNDGRMRVRFNKYVEEKTRVELAYIPVPRTLQDNAISVPLLPESFRNLLVFGAAYYIQLDKTDDKAQTNFTLASQKLKSLQAANRKNVQLAGANWGRVIPRRGFLDRRNRLFQD